MRVRIPSHARSAARMGLRERKRFSRRPGLTRAQARKAGVQSGVVRARQIIRNKTLSKAQARSVGRFYDRFKNQRTPRAEVALKLWGGRRFARSLSKKF